MSNETLKKPRKSIRKEIEVAESQDSLPGLYFEKREQSHGRVVMPEDVRNSDSEKSSSSNRIPTKNVQLGRDCESSRL